MDTNEKKPRRPRIGEMKSMSDNSDSLSTNSYTQSPTAGSSTSDGEQSGESTYNRPYSRQGGYNNRPNYRQGGYQPRPYNNYNRQGGYNNNRQYNGGYQQRPYNNYNPNPEATTDAATTDSAAATSAEHEGGYQPRPYNNNRQGGYNNRQQGGYNNNRQGGYNNRMGGYNNRQQGGYGNNRQGGYGNNRQRPNNNYGMPLQGKSFTPRPKRVEYEQPILDPNEQIRLNKYMANAGICSRREADEYIQQGLVKVNGQVVTELGTKITHADTVEYDEKVVTLENK